MEDTKEVMSGMVKDLPISNDVLRGHWAIGTARMEAQISTYREASRMIRGSGFIIVVGTLLTIRASEAESPSAYQ